MNFIQLDKAALAYIRNIYEDIPSNSTAYAYMQLKFNTTGIPVVGQVNNFRSSEMLLIEVEAKYKQGELATTIQPIDSNNWKIVTSGKETDFNSGIKQ